MFRPEQPLIMAGLLAYSLSGRLPVSSSEALAKEDPSALNLRNLTVAGLP